MNSIYTIFVVRGDYLAMENKYFVSERLLYRPARIEDLQTFVKFNNEPSRRKWFYFQEPDCLTEEFVLKGIQENIEMWSKKVNVLEGQVYQ